MLHHEDKHGPNRDGRINAKDRAGQTALHRAVEQDDAVAVQ